MPIKYQARIDQSCRCSSLVIAQQPSGFPANANLNCETCIRPGILGTDCIEGNIPKTTQNINIHTDFFYNFLVVFRGLSPNTSGCGYLDPAMNFVGIRYPAGDTSGSIAWIYSCNDSGDSGYDNAFMTVNFGTSDGCVTFAATISATGAPALGSTLTNTPVNSFLYGDKQIVDIEYSCFNDPHSGLPIPDCTTNVWWS